VTTSPLSRSAAGAPHRLDVVAPDTSQASTAERELDARGAPIPLWSRPSVALHLAQRFVDFIIATDARGEYAGMLAARRSPTRALPGHQVMRVKAVGDSFASGVGMGMLEAAQRLASSRSRVLRLVVEIECREDEPRRLIGSALEKLGFHRIPCESISARTLAIDLAPDEEAILAGFGRSTRQNVRGAAKHDLQLVPLDDPGFARRMNDLLTESLSRTGAAAQTEDWPAVMRLCAALPERSRLIGVFRGSTRTPDDLVGFAWALHHGDRVQYHTGASARIPGVRLPILYPALWDLIQWARRSGGTWFDLGGVTAGSSGSDDALGGISDFKRGFSKVEVEVGQEWAFEPSPARWRLANLNARIARWIRKRTSRS
jgi:hypothetical protein